MSYGIYLYRQDAIGLREADREAVREALARWGWDGSEESPYPLATEDGTTVEFYASGLDGGAPFYGGNLEVRGFSLELCRLVFDLARAGSYTVSHDGDASALILVRESQREELSA